MNNPAKLRKLVVDRIGDGCSDADIVAAILRSDRTLTTEEAAKFLSSVIFDIAKDTVEFDKNRSLNITITLLRYTAIYQACFAAGDFKTALAAQKEIAKLQQIDSDGGSTRGPGNRGKSPSASIPTNQRQVVDNSIRSITDLTDEELLRLTQEHGDEMVSTNQLPSHILESEATRLLHAQDDE